MRRYLLKVLNEEDPTTLGATMWLNYKCLLFIGGHITFTSVFLFRKIECHRHKVEVMLEVPHHSLKNFGELSLVCGGACPRKSIEDGVRAHDSLVVFSVMLWKLPNNVCFGFSLLYLTPTVYLNKLLKEG